MKLTFILEMLLILIIVAYGAYGKPLESESRGIKANVRQAVEVAAVTEAAIVQPVTEDDDDIDILGLLVGDDDGDGLFELLIAR